MTKIVGLKLAACSKFGNANVGEETDIERGVCGARHGSVDVEDKWMVEGAAESEGLVLRRDPEGSGVWIGKMLARCDGVELGLCGVARRYGASLKSKRAALVQSGPLGERAHRTAVRDGDASSGSADALGPD